MNTQVPAFRFQPSDKARSGRTISLADLLHTLKCWHARSRQRRQLAQLPPEMLKDIGISRYDALSEAAKPFWKG